MALLCSTLMKRRQPSFYASHNRKVQGPVLSCKQLHASPCLRMGHSRTFQVKLTRAGNPFKLVSRSSGGYWEVD